MTASAPAPKDLGGPGGGGPPADGGGPAPAPAPPAPAPAPPPAPAGGGISDDLGAAPAPAAGDWAALRSGYAGADDKKLARLSRFASFNAAMDSLFAAETKLGQVRAGKPLSENPTPEELADFRKSEGIPEKADAYDLAGIKMDETDAPIIGNFLKTAHESNLKPAQVKAAVGWFMAEKARQQEATETLSAETKRAGEEALRSEWGGEYRGNMAGINNLLATAPAGTKELLYGATRADGVPLGKTAELMRWLNDVSRTINPAATLLPQGGAASIDDELAQIEKKVGTKEYWKDEKQQARYRDLLTARDARKPQKTATEQG